MSTNFKIGIEKRETKRRKRKEARRSSGQRMNAAISGRKLPEALPPTDAGDDPSAATPVPEIVEEPPATPALEFNFCPPPAEVTPPPTTPGEQPVEERLLELERQLRERDDTIGFLRLQLRNREAVIADLRSQLPSTSASTSSQITPNRGRPAKNVDELKRSARRELADKLVAVLDRDRSRSASRNGLERLHRKVRHRFQHFTPLKKDAKQSDEPMGAEDALLILALVGTQKAYAKLKRTLRVIDCKFDVVPSLKKVVEIKRQICAPLCYETVGTGSGVGFWCADIEKALTFRLRSARDNLKNISTDVLLKISGDYGQGFTKITISFGEAQRPNSPSNNFIAAVFPAKDSRANLELYCGSLWTQIDQLKSLAGKSVKWFLGGDVSFVWAVIGHCGSAVTTFPSPVCTCRRDQLLDAEACCFRSVEETVLQAQQFAMAIQRDEALHSVWRRLEQFWKTMPDAEQMRQQLENHFVSNWLLDTGKFEEMQMLRMEEQSTGELEEDRMDEERDEDGFIDLIG
uniref:Uncharacterized protein n=1 Tax=Globodera rostochiensis TaxID=31243 RepID=A0A914GXW4_GLORO